MELRRRVELTPESPLSVQFGAVWRSRMGSAPGRHRDNASPYTVNRASREAIATATRSPEIGTPVLSAILVRWQSAEDPQKIVAADFGGPMPFWEIGWRRLADLMNCQVGDAHA